MLVDINLEENKTNAIKIDPRIEIDPRRTIFWTGAGISSEAPSSLPLGNELTDVYLENTLGPRWEQLVALWNNYFPQIKDAVKEGRWRAPEPEGKYTEYDVKQGKAWHRPRLEYIVGEIDKLDKYFGSISFENPENKELFSRRCVLEALEGFAHVKPCLNHYRLSDLAREGALMVTSNFDDGIEKALGADSTKIIYKHNTVATAHNYGEYIYHIHGIATDKTDNLGVTISKVSTGLDEDFQSYLTERFSEGYNIVFIGYSGMDFFDVEPFFKGLKPDTYTGKAIYLHYCLDNKKISDKMREEKPYNYLLSPFKNQYIAYGKTEDFFNSIYGKYRTVTVSKTPSDAFKLIRKKLEDIASSQKDKEMYYFINMFRLCSQLNISPGRFYNDWIKRISELFAYWESDGNNTLRNMAVIDGQKNDGILEDIFSNNWFDEDLNSTGLIKKLSPFMKEWEKKHQTIMSIFNTGILKYVVPLPKCVLRHYLNLTVKILDDNRKDEKSSDISRSTVMYFCGAQTKIAIFIYLKSRGIIKGRMLFIKNCINELLSFPFTRFRYRTHYLSLCRQLGYIEAAINRSKKDYQGDIQKEWDICMQTPILFDAGQVIKARLKQAEICGITDGVEDLNKIRELILDLRKAKSEL